MTKERIFNLSCYYCNLGPSATLKTVTFTLNPLPEVSSSGCSAAIAGSIAHFVNGWNNSSSINFKKLLIILLLFTGVPLYGWSDTNSYNSKGVWNNLAGSFELLDFDPCAGHAANGEYHR